MSLYVYLREQKEREGNANRENIRKSSSHWAESETEREINLEKIVEQRRYGLCLVVGGTLVP